MMDGSPAKNQADSLRPFHIVVWGATGFVGKLVCEHLARDYQGEGIQWALAGRNKSKLEAVREEISAIDPSLKTLDILLGDIKDEASLDALVSQTQVLLATAGPFARLATPLVAACVRNGTHYCDITGEIPWVRRMIQEHHEEAERKGVAVVHCCGYDSVPSDLGAFYMATHMKQMGKKCASVTTLVGPAKGTFSGGTLASLFGAFFEEPAEDRKAVADPYCLDPPNSRRGHDKADFWGVGYNRPTGKFTMPFLMQPVNTRIVRRSNALLGHAYGEEFRYSEAMEAPFVVAMLGALALFWAFLLFSIRPLHGLYRRLLPKVPGPSKELQRKGYWTHTLVAESQEEEGVAPAVVLGRVCGQRDPGYWETSRFLLEAGLCLALQKQDLEKSGLRRGGVLTPASAMGSRLIARLKRAGVTFEVQHNNSREE
ncbi:hypothetical protein WJX72_004892 [[Myrmecia] bisecta]|uniref:Saccharopine dehydrogenase NADP binding domain-containing protein n=1 Tax=[Myrmecia] bisecta TaxID=41462 RepID=A0AAW1R6N5_9CHLO